MSGRSIPLSLKCVRSNCYGRVLPFVRLPYPLRNSYDFALEIPVTICRTRGSTSAMCKSRRRRFSHYRRNPVVDDIRRCGKYMNCRKPCPAGKSCSTSGQHRGLTGASAREPSKKQGTVPVWQELSSGLVRQVSRPSLLQTTTTVGSTAVQRPVLTFRLLFLAEW